MNKKKGNIVNFSRYDAGDFLDSHGDTPSGSLCYERRQAFVWHLSEGWSASDGGLFVDEESKDKLNAEDQTPRLLSFSYIFLC